MAKCMGHSGTGYAVAVDERHWGRVFSLAMLNNSAYMGRGVSTEQFAS